MPSSREEACRGRLVRVGALAEGRPGRDRRAMPGRQVIEDDDLVAGGEERLDRHRADIAGAAGDQDPRHARNDTRGQGRSRRIVRLIVRVT